MTPNQAEAEYYEALFEAESTVQVKSENNSEECQNLRLSEGVS